MASRLHRRAVQAISGSIRPDRGSWIILVINGNTGNSSGLSLKPAIGENTSQARPPILEANMFQNKWFNWVYIVVGLSLLTVGVLTVRAAMATATLADRSYDSVEQVRASRAAALADHS